MGHGAALMKVFLPYLKWNTVFATRSVTKSAASPCRFQQYSLPLLKFSLDNHSISVPALARSHGGTPQIDLNAGTWVSSSIEMARLRWMLGGAIPGARAKS